MNLPGWVVGKSEESGKAGTGGGLCRGRGEEGWTSISRERVQGVRDKGDRHMEPEKETEGGEGGAVWELQGITERHSKK